MHVLLNNIYQFSIALNAILLLFIQVKTTGRIIQDTFFQPEKEKTQVDNKQKEADCQQI